MPGGMESFRIVKLRRREGKPCVRIERRTPSSTVQSRFELRGNERSKTWVWVEGYLFPDEVAIPEKIWTEAWRSVLLAR